MDMSTVVHGHRKVAEALMVARPLGIINFDWTSDVWLRTRQLPISAFADMLVEGGNVPLTYADLQARYYEWCEALDLLPIRGWGRWQRAIKAAGIVRRRSSRRGRPWLYTVYRPTRVADVAVIDDHWPAPSVRRA